MSIVDIIEQVRKLSNVEKKALVEQLIAEMPEPEEKRPGILELRGLGKDIWAGIDAQEYVHQMRDEWDEERP